ncbi:MAG: hypothetical protein AAF206_05850, partial [Bacteroidota bacterium]
AFLPHLISFAMSQDHIRTFKAAVEAYFAEPDYLDTEIGEFEIPGEKDVIRRFVDIFAGHFQKHYRHASASAPDKKYPVQRAIHAKSHGLLNAKLEIFDHQDPALQHSIFKVAHTYDAKVRVSNGDGPAGPDTDKIASIGFAIKVRGVSGEKFLPMQIEDSQDFLFLNQPKYISNDVRDYESLMRAIDGGLGARLKALFTNTRGLLYRRTASPKDDPLNTFYWGVAPFRLGDIAVKFLIRPATPKAIQKNKHADGLKPMLQASLNQDDVVYDFYIQKRVKDGTEDQSMPIEDYGIAWDETVSIPVKVGRLTIFKQRIDEQKDAEGFDEGEHLVFTPWNTTKDLRPLGSLNRARRVVYPFSVINRHRLNEKRNPLEKE